METKFNTPEEERAYKLGQIDGMLICIQNTIKNLKLQYEKIYEKRLKLK
ncbi:MULTISPECIES: hypothetical protein [Dysgonomonas]|nr:MULTISPECIES: hypothetical protein [Dysgonomonas]